VALLNLTEPRDLIEHIHHRWAVATRRLGSAAALAFASASGLGPHVERIYVINLDRKSDRWRRIQAELRRIKGADGRPLSNLTRRYSAVDARYIDLSVEPDVIDPTYTLAEQLFVQPDTKIGTDAATLARTVTMSRQEVNRPGFDAHLVCWEGCDHAEAVRRADEGQGGSPGA
jgi:hypothetical protein